MMYLIHDTNSGDRWQFPADRAKIEARRGDYDTDGAHALDDALALIEAGCLDGDAIQHLGWKVTVDDAVRTGGKRRYGQRMAQRERMVEDAHREFERAEAVFGKAEAAYHSAIREAVAGGMTRYRVSVITGITQPRVNRIVEAGS